MNKGLVILFFVFSLSSSLVISTKYVMGEEGSISDKASQIGYFDRTPIHTTKIPLSVQEKDNHIISMENLELQPPQTVVSSLGEIATPEKQKEFIGKNKLNMKPKTSLESKDEYHIELVVGSDERVKISDTTESPYRNIAFIEVRHPNGKWYNCSGWFMDKNTVVTAAHCVFDTYNNYWYTDAYVYPARDGDKYPYNYWYSKEFWVNTAYINAGAPSFGSIYYNNVKNDYAVINLVDNYSHPSVFNIRYWNHDDGEGVIAAGYPADKGYYYMYKAQGTGNYDSSYDVLVYNADTNSGESGGPVYNSKVGFLGVVGINSSGKDSYNWSPEITEATYNHLVYMANQ